MIELLAQETVVSPSVVLLNTIALLARYLHIVCTTLLVGGTLFYEMVVPVAIADMKAEQQLAIFARARWVFRRVVWFAVAGVVITGIASTSRHWQAYAAPEQVAAANIRRALEHAATRPAGEIHIPTIRSPAMLPGWWWVAHASTGAMAALIALFLTGGRTPPSNPVRWMRFNLVILMIVIFLASATRHVRIATTEVETIATPDAQN